MIPHRVHSNGTHAATCADCARAAERIKERRRNREAKAKALQMLAPSLAEALRALCAAENTLEGAAQKWAAAEAALREYDAIGRITPAPGIHPRAG